MTNVRTATIEKVLSLPIHHFFVLIALTDWTTASGEIAQPVTSAEVHDAYQRQLDESAQVGDRALREIVT